MSDQWEKYIEPATEALRQNGFVDPDDDTVPVYPDDSGIPYWVRAENPAAAVVAAIAPLIAEDTRERLVAAAARAVERERASAENPFESLRKTLAFSSNDWGSAGDFAWLYGIVFGWSDDEGGDHLEDLAAKFDWTPDAVARLRKLHTSFEAAAQAWECAS